MTREKAAFFKLKSAASLLFGTQDESVSSKDFNPVAVVGIVKSLVHHHEQNEEAQHGTEDHSYGMS